MCALWCGASVRVASRVASPYHRRRKERKENGNAKKSPAPSPPSARIQISSKRVQFTPQVNRSCPDTRPLSYLFWRSLPINREIFCMCETRCFSLPLSLFLPPGFPDCDCEQHSVTLSWLSFLQTFPSSPRASVGK